MARMRMVTRTVKVTDATALCADIVNAEFVNRTERISAVANKDAAMKELKKIIEAENSNLKVVDVVDLTTAEILYGMPEAEFIAHAEILPPRTAVEAEAED